MKFIEDRIVNLVKRLWGHILDFLFCVPSIPDGIVSMLSKKSNIFSTMMHISKEELKDKI